MTEYVMMERDRWERVRRAADASFVVYDWESDEARGEAECAWCALRRDDLRPVAVTLSDADREALAREICEIVGAEDYQLVESDIQKMCGECVDGWYVIVDDIAERWHIVRRTPEQGAE